MYINQLNHLNHHKTEPYVNYSVRFLAKRLIMTVYWVNPTGKSWIGRHQCSLEEIPLHKVLVHRFWSSRNISYGFTTLIHLTLDFGSKQAGMAGKWFLPQHLDIRHCQILQGELVPPQKRKRPKNPNFDINQKKIIPYCYTPCNWLRLHWNLQNVIYCCNGQFNQTQRLIQTSGFYGFYSFLLKWPEKWFRFRFRFSEQYSKVNLIWFNV